MNRRSMGGRIYQEQTFKPRLISLKNPQQRNILYPIKGDTSFQPTQYGRKHYFSPKHSAIHSIIFNQDYKKLMQQKGNLIKKLNIDHSSYAQQNFNQRKSNERKQYNEKQGKNNIKILDMYLNDYVIQDNKVNNSTNVFPPYNVAGNGMSGSMINSEKVERGRLFRHGSMNEVLKPFEPLQKLQRSQAMQSSRDSLSVLDSPLTLQRNQSLNFQRSMSYNSNYKQAKQLNINFTRLINPSNLNSRF